MIHKTPDDYPPPRRADGWLSRERSLALVLIVASSIVSYLCYRLILPFLPALAWALALAVMAILAVIPMLGTFVIWAPVAVFLFIQGEWISAVTLVAWGAIAIGLIDNLLYPFLVGKRMRLHTLLVFFAIVGGVMLFGASGLILGPLLLAFADALLEIWSRRTAGRGSLEETCDS